jgi:hypothetical protein
MLYSRNVLPTVIWELFPGFELDAKVLRNCKISGQIEDALGASNMSHGG